MSYTTLYAIARDGSLVEWREYKNSHGSAPAIWSTLAPKYVADVAPLGEHPGPHQRHWLFGDAPGRPSPMQELWKLANEGGMQEFERRACWTTYDRACVRIEDVPLYADALDEFTRVYGPVHERLGYVFHIGAMAADLRSIYQEREENGWRGVAWNQTSTADTWHSQEPTDEQRRDGYEKRVRDAVPGLREEDVDAVVDLMMEVAEAAEDGEERVEDNVDHFGCTWLPTANVNTLGDPEDDHAV